MERSAKMVNSFQLFDYFRKTLHKLDFDRVLNKALVIKGKSIGKYKLHGEFSKSNSGHQIDTLQFLAYKRRSTC